MQLSKLLLKNFRLFASKELRLNDGLNFLDGPNGAGKTSLLESVYYTCYASSFRATNRQELIKEGESTASVELKFNNDHKIFIGFDSKKKSLKLTTNH